MSALFSLILPNPSLTLRDADLGSVASQAGSGHFRKNSNSLHVGTAGFQTTLLNVTGSLVVGVTTVFQCIGGIFKILLNIPRLGSSQQVDTAVSDSATPNKERDFFLVASSVECSAGLPSCIETEPSQCESEPKVQEEKKPSGVVFNMSWRLKQKRQLLLAVEVVVELSSPQPEGLTLTTKLGASQDNQHSLTTFALK